MAVLPLFSLGPATILSLIGHIRGAKAVQLPDIAAVRELDIDIVIPAFNERNTIALCLASILRQTIKPNSVTVIDDGSSDDTAAVAEAFAAARDLPIRLIRHPHSIGKTPGLRIAAHELEGDVQFVLDADTVLLSDDYVEQVVAQLFRVPGIASTCGVVYPLRNRHRTALSPLDNIRQLRQKRSQPEVVSSHKRRNGIAKALGNLYRDVIFQFMHVFFHAGVQKLFGSMANPVGCAVAYRREYLKAIFDRYEPAMGDNLTSSEDIFIGTAFIANGYRNTQTLDVIALTEVPAIHKIPQQQVKWSLAWLQTAYYLPDMLFSPFRVFRRLKHNKKNGSAPQTHSIVDGYRQPLGLQYTKQLGRPSGWMIFSAILEKASYTFILWGLVVISAWWSLAATITLDMIFFTLFLTVFSTGRRLEFAVKGVLSTPLRYGMMVLDVVVLAQFLFDLATGRRDWRK